MKKLILIGCSRSGEIEVGACLQKIAELQWLPSYEIRRLLSAGEPVVDSETANWIGADATRQTLSISRDAKSLGIDEDAIFVFLVREPRACVAHLAQRKLTPLLDAFGMKPLDELRAEYPDEVAAIEAATPAVAAYGRAALWWKMNYAVLHDLRESGADVLAVSYDSFMENPGPHLRAICAELGATYSEELLPDDNANVGGYSDEQWRGLLSDEQRTLIEQIGASAMRSAWTTGRRS